jgi:hypothetical protein
MRVEGDISQHDIMNKLFLLLAPTFALRARLIVPHLNQSFMVESWLIPLNGISGYLIPVNDCQNVKPIIEPWIALIQEPISCLSGAKAIVTKKYFKTDLPMVLMTEWDAINATEPFIVLIQQDGNLLELFILTIIIPIGLLIGLLMYGWYRELLKREKAPVTLVEALPIIEFQGESCICNTKNNSFQGPICLEDFQEGEELKKLPCHHYYHISCINR